MRIHIPLGKHIEAKIVTAVWCVMLAVAILFPGTAEAQAKKLISAQGGPWRSDVYVYRPLDSDVVTPPLPDHAGSGGCVTPDVTLGVAKAAVVRDYTNTMPLLCRAPFQLIDPPKFPSFVVASFDNGPLKFSFKVPPIGAISVDHAAYLFPVVSDGVDEAILNLFPSEPTTVYWRFLGQDEESCNAKPPVTQCKVSAFGSGALTVYLKPAVICNLCIDPKPVYGLVTNGRPNGAALTAFPF